MRPKCGLNAAKKRPKSGLKTTKKRPNYDQNTQNVFSSFQELLFCETCDTVFCTLCTGGTHKPGGTGSSPNTSPTHSGIDSGNNSPTHTSSSTADHTVIPFSIAIKRMSEILIYKANECTAKLDEATEIVNNEIHRLDHNADSAFEQVNARFQVILNDKISKNFRPK